MRQVAEPYPDSGTARLSIEADRTGHPQPAPLADAELALMKTYPIAHDTGACDLGRAPRGVLSAERGGELHSRARASRRSHVLDRNC
jgi:hypothetical protein